MNPPSPKFPAVAVLAVLTAIPAVAPAQQEITLRPGLVITSSVRATPRVYDLPAPAAMDSAVIVIRGDDIVVDFAGAEMRGAAIDADPDAGAGVAVRIEGGSNVTIRNLRARGYKVAVMARRTRGLSLLDNDLSYNWKPRLFSIVEHESLTDWLSYHHNEDDEWLRFGAAAYLADVRGGDIRGNRVEQGMNGFLLVRTDSMRIRNNIVSFNSGLGFGLYRSSFNTIMHNRADYNVRGYSEGFYRRGQDSADLLMYEQSSHNVVAFNSMTHGGDGLFLWAGQTTMDSGQGGANDNLFFANDFSFAPTNGMEATFSRNRFIGNRVEGSEHGLWGGYSYESEVIGNQFIGNRYGISIEHGQDNLIRANHFERDSTAIQIWANPTQPTDWGYPKNRDTRSRGYRIENNTLVRSRVGVRATRTRDGALLTNAFVGVDSAFVASDTTAWRVADNDSTGAAGEIGLPAGLPRPLPDAMDVTSPLAKAPRSAIVVDEWGPYDWGYPVLWPADSARSSPLRLRVLGPEGTWRVVDRRGVARLSRESGTMRDTIVVTPAAGMEVDWSLGLEYTGVAFDTRRGDRHAAGRPFRFGYERFEPAIDWTVRWFAWNERSDPRATPAGFDALLRGAPVLTQHVSRLDYMWYRPTLAGLPPEQSALRATGTVTLPPGQYTVRTISDDAVRLWIDGRLVIDAWTPHESSVDHADLAGGRHELRVEHFQVGGWTELRLEIVRGRGRHAGSPGPH